MANDNNDPNDDVNQAGLHLEEASNSELEETSGSEFLSCDEDEESPSRRQLLTPVDDPAILQPLLSLAELAVGQPLFLPVAEPAALQPVFVPPENPDLPQLLFPPKDPGPEEEGYEEKDPMNFRDKVDFDELTFSARAAERLVRKVMEEAEQAEQFVRKMWEGAWKVCHFKALPKWLQDNDFLLKGHRPELKSFKACFRSIFRIHTETGNIWTHLLGCLLFIGIAAYFLSRPSDIVNIEEKAIFATFFLSAIICLGMSFTFHTVSCHSEHVGKLFSKLDYCGISILIIGSFIPWLYYGFYCEYQHRIVYFSLVVVLGLGAITVSMWDKFSEPQYRWLRAGVFAAFGLSGVIPAVHYLIIKGYSRAVYDTSLGWLCLMGAMYLIGAGFYALRIPERFFPGHCDIWFQSHQIFHVLVIIGAIIHYQGIYAMMINRLSHGTCHVQEHICNVQERVCNVYER